MEEKTAVTLVIYEQLLTFWLLRGLGHSEGTDTSGKIPCSSKMGKVSALQVTYRIFKKSQTKEEAGQKKMW